MIGVDRLLNDPPWREYRGLTQAVLAKKVALSQAAIADIEFGMLARVSADSQCCILHGEFPLTRMVPA